MPTAFDEELSYGQTMQRNTILVALSPGMSNDSNH